MNRQKILIVDDSELNREMLKAILGEEYDYAEAEDGAQAILMLQQDMNIDLLLLDINMPKIDGFGVLERLNQFRWIEELPVIMISATEDRAVIERCYSLGITDYIRRPFELLHRAAPRQKHAHALRQPEAADGHGLRPDLPEREGQPCS